MSYKPKHILITGGAGFIGSNFIRSQAKHFSRIVNLDLLTYAGDVKNLPHSFSEYIFVKGDIADHELVAKILRDYEIDTILHFAAETHVDRSIDASFVFTHTNVIGTHVLLECAKRYWFTEKKWDERRCRFHHISTDEVYGSLQELAPAFTEDSKYAPNSPYAASKAASDHLVRAYQHTFGLPTVISLCSNNYGPHQHVEKFIPTVITSLLRGKKIPIYGTGKNIRDWIFVEDHCRGILKVLTLGTLGASYHLGGQCEMTNLDMAKTICKMLAEEIEGFHNSASLLEFVPDRLGHDWRYAMNIEKAKSSLHWQPEISLQNGLQKTIRFYTEKLKIQERTFA